MKTCSKCKQIKSFEDFYSHASNKDGLSHNCRPCDRAAVTRSQQKKLDYLRQVKSQPCQICGVEYPPYVMDLHHVDPSIKNHKPSDLVTRSWAVLFAEVKKCVVLCANCHREVEHGDKCFNFEMLMSDNE